MNFKLKALVAAVVATVTMSGAANALTNNEMFLVAYDATASKTFIAALGAAGTTSAFTGVSNLSVNYATDANWMSFMSTATTYSTPVDTLDPVTGDLISSTGGASGVVYQVLGFNSAGSGGWNASDRLLATSNTAPNTLKNLAMTAMMTDVKTPSSVLGGFMTLNAAITSNSTGLVLGAGADSGAAVGTDIFTKYSGFDATAFLGTDLSFYSLTRPATNTTIGAGAEQIKTQFVLGSAGSAGDTWNLSSNGLLTYTAVAAVPEADTSAMMLMGLGLMGFIARRRRRA